jgi:hypothetical protein
VRTRLGINTCFAVKRWPRLEDWAPIVTGELGLRLVQHSFDLVAAASPMDEAAQFGRSVRARGMELHSSFTGLAAYSDNLLLGPETAGRERAERWLEWAIDWTAAAGGRAAGGHVGAFSVADWRDPVRRTQRWTDLQAALARLAGRARAAGLDYLMVENLAAAREPSTMAMIGELLTDGDTGRAPIRLCLDVGHMCAPGTSGPDRDPLAWLATLGSVAPVVQLQQSDADGDHHWPFTFERNTAGRIRADEVLDALERSGVTETVLILEMIPPFEQDDDALLDDLRTSVAYWRTALERRGLTV